MKVLVPLQRLLSRSDFCDVFSQKAFGKAGPAGQPGLRSQGLVGRLLGSAGLEKGLLAGRGPASQPPGAADPPEAASQLKSVVLFSCFFSCFFLLLGQIAQKKAQTPDQKKHKKKHNCF